jgi:hypothetical protein
MDVLLVQLVEGGFVEPSGGAAPAVATASQGTRTPAGAAASLDQSEALKAARNVIRKLVYDQLGPDGDMIVGKLEKCESRLQLVTYCDTCKDVVEAALGKSKGQALWAKIKESIETAFAGVDAGSGPGPTLASPAAPSAPPALPPSAAPAAMPPATPAAPSPAVAAAAPPPAAQPKREVEKWMFEKVRGEISRLVFDTLGPDGELMAMKIEDAKSMNDIRAQGEMIFEVVRGMRGKQKAIEIKARMEGLIAAVEGG